MAVACSRQRAQSMVAQNQQIQAGTSVVKNDNRKQVSVNIKKINIQSSANTIERTIANVAKGLKNYYWNQLGTSLV